MGSLNCIIICVSFMLPLCYGRHILRQIGIINSFPEYSVHTVKSNISQLCYHNSLHTFIFFFHKIFGRRVSLLHHKFEGCWNSSFHTSTLWSLWLSHNWRSLWWLRLHVLWCSYVIPRNCYDFFWTSILSIFILHWHYFMIHYVQLSCWASN